jgi:hypothetical protein
MKKLAIGCAVVLLLCGIVAAGVAFYVYRQASTMLTQFADLKNISELERGLRVRGPYTPPASGELTSVQLERLLRVQTQVRERLGQRFTQIEQRYKSLSEKEHATIADAPALMAAYRDLAEAWMAAKRSQIDALNDASLSLEEYRWIRDQTYRAIGTPFVDLDIGKFVEQIGSGNVTPETQPGQLRGSIGPAGPEANRKLVEPFKKQLESNLPLASFGL